MPAPAAEKDGPCVYTPHSLPATTATLLLDAGVDVTKTQELLGSWQATPIGVRILGVIANVT